jgi:hypothetical protein
MTTSCGEETMQAPLNEYEWEVNDLDIDIPTSDSYKKSSENPEDIRLT